MTKMRLVIVFLLILILAGFSVELYLMFKEKNQLWDKIGGLNNRLEALVKENVDLRSEIEYFSHPENLEKELRSKFNYKKPDEKMMIIVP